MNDFFIVYKKMISKNISINKNLKQTKSNFEFENIKVTLHYRKFDKFINIIFYQEINVIKVRALSEKMIYYNYLILNKN